MKYIMEERAGKAATGLAPGLPWACPAI